MTKELARVRKAFPRTFGKVQDANRARFLTYAEAYEVLIPACQDKTWTGSRDQLVIRLGLSGARADEIARLTWGDYADGRFTYTGKKNRSRVLVAGPTMAALMTRWAQKYTQQVGRPIAPTDPIICRTLGSNQHAAHRIDWAAPTTADYVWHIVTRRAEAAGLGHVAPHDLRRSAASILHNAKTPDGGHIFDLRDIQVVLDHADPATTQRSYLDQIDTEAKDRAADFLD